MSRKLLVLNGLFLAVTALAVASITRQVLTPRPLPGPARSATAVAPPAQPEAPPVAGGAYAVIAARNPFSPTRTETPGAAAAPAAVVAKPGLYGVVLRQGKPPVAYLEDPVSKRTSGYRIGDTVAGGKLRAIKRDSVTIERGDGQFDVALRDPSKPRAAPPTPAAAGAAPGTAPRPLAPIPGPASPQPPAVPGAQVAPPATQQGAVGDASATQGRRLPFNFMRRLRPPTAGQAPAVGPPPAVAPPPAAPGAPLQGQQD